MDAMNPEALTADIQLFHGKLKMPLVQLPLTSALVTLSAGKVLLSPHPSLTADELRGMGAVTDIVAPNLFHHLGIANAVAAHPQARLWGVAGFERKRKDIAWGAFLDARQWPHQQELVAVHCCARAKCITIWQSTGKSTRLQMSPLSEWSSCIRSRLRLWAKRCRSTRKRCPCSGYRKKLATWERGASCE